MRLFRLIGLFSTVACFCWAQSPLETYVSIPDEAYGWEVVSSTKRDYFTYHVLRLRSQQWRSAEEVDHPVWEHWLRVIEPCEITSNQALMHISGGYNDEEIPQEIDNVAPHIAWATGSLVIELRMVPNQSLRFFDEVDVRYQQEGRREDQLVAYTWAKYLDNQDPTWLATFPMTKAVVRAMDAVQEFAKQKLYSNVDQFVLVGASKRGWTAWTAAAVDRRVVGIAALVIDLLNLKESMRNHFCSYGSFSKAIADYTDMGIHHRMHTEPFQQLIQLIEPFSHKERLTMPKLIINATGDEFFTPDSSRFYFHQLHGPKFLRYIPNANHYLGNTDAAATVAAFYASLVTKQTLPHCWWDLDEEGVLTIQFDKAPRFARLWSAFSPTSRDFRLSSIGPAWSSKMLPLSTQTLLQVELLQPSEGWQAYMVELTFDGPFGLPFRQTTDVFILPDWLPYAPDNSNE